MQQELAGVPELPGGGRGGVCPAGGPAPRLTGWAALRGLALSGHQGQEPHFLKVAGHREEV